MATAIDALGATGQADDGYLYYPTDGVPIKAWVHGVPVDEKAMQQVRNVAALPFVHKHVALMPDVHLGYGATVGSVIPTHRAIVPAAVGVDIGCGMMAVRTSLKADDLPDNLGGLRSAIEEAVPHGRTNDGGKGDRGAWRDVPDDVARNYTVRGKRGQSLEERLREILDRTPKLRRQEAKAPRQLGTLGTGNHFIEVCLDEDDHVWAMLHSGSRGVGNGIGTCFIELARKDMERYFIRLPDRDLAYLVEGTDHFKDYVRAVSWAQDYAAVNRTVMMERVLKALAKVVRRFERLDQAVNCHHNYVAREKHFRTERLGDPQGRGAGPCRRPRHHPRLDGRAVLHRARQGQRQLVPLLLARRRAGHVARGGEADVHARRPPPGDRGRRVPQGQRRDRRDAGRLQGHRRRDGGAARPGRHRPHVEAGGLRQRLSAARLLGIVGHRHRAFLLHEQHQHDA